MNCLKDKKDKGGVTDLARHLDKVYDRRSYHFDSWSFQIREEDLGFWV